MGRLGSDLQDGATVNMRDNLIPARDNRAGLEHARGKSPRAGTMFKFQQQAVVAGMQMDRDLNPIEGKSG